MLNSRKGSRRGRLKVLAALLILVPVSTEAQNQPNPTPTATPLPIISPLAVKEHPLFQEAFGRCSKLKAAYAAAFADPDSDAYQKLLSHGRTHCRALQECQRYIHQDGTSGPGAIFDELPGFRQAVCPDFNATASGLGSGNVIDHANALIFGTTRTSRALENALKEGIRDTNVLRERAGIAEHKFDLGNDAFLGVMAGDVADHAIGLATDGLTPMSTDDCVDHRWEGICYDIDFDWSLLNPIPDITIYLSILRSYRFPVQLVETSEHKGLTAYYPESSLLPELPVPLPLTAAEMIELGEFVLREGPYDPFDSAVANMKAAGNAVEGAAALPGSTLGLFDELSDADIEISSNAEDLARNRYEQVMTTRGTIGNEEVTSRIREQPWGQGRNMQYHIARTMSDYMLGAAWQKLSPVVPRHPHYQLVWRGLLQTFLSAMGVPPSPFGAITISVYLSTHVGGCHDRKVTGRAGHCRQGDTIDDCRGGWLRDRDCNQRDLDSARRELLALPFVPYWSEGGFYSPTSVFFANNFQKSLHALGPMNLVTFGLMSAVDAEARLLAPFACTLYNMYQGTSQSDRLRPQADMLLPYFNKEAVKELVTNLPVNITKYCGGGNTMNLFPLLSRAPNDGGIGAAMHQTLVGLKAVETTFPIRLPNGSRINNPVRDLPYNRFYEYSDYRGRMLSQVGYRDPNDRDNDRLQWKTSPLKERFPGCKAFNLKTLPFERNFHLASRKRVVNDEERVATHQIAYHWKRFKCCHPNLTQGIIGGIPLIPLPVLGGDLTPPKIIYGNEGRPR